jgi:hypothetical protein
MRQKSLLKPVFKPNGALFTPRDPKTAKTNYGFIDGYNKTRLGTISAKYKQANERWNWRLLCFMDGTVLRGTAREVMLFLGEA